MSKLNELRERRNTLARETRNIMDQHRGASWTDEHQKQYDASFAEIERLDAEMEREQRILNIEAESRFKDAGVKQVDPAPKNTSRAIYSKWLRGGDSALSGEDWGHVRNVLSTGVGAEGGFSVQNDVASELISALKEYGGMRAAATVFTTENGASMSWPTNDDTAAVGELIAENATATDADPAFGTVALPTYKYSSKVVTVPWELMQDSTLNLEALVQELLVTRLGRITNTHFTVGTGTAQPRGVVTASTAGKVGATGQTLTVVYDDLVDLEHSLDPAYRNGASWMMHDSSVKVIRKIKDADGRPIFVPGFETGSPGGAPASLLNRPIIINQDVAVMAANAISILFGNFKNYRIRDVMQVTMFRFSDSAYAKKGQVGFLAWMRSGGNLIDVSGATVKRYVNSAT